MTPEHDCHTYADNQGSCHTCGRPVNPDAWMAYYGASKIAFDAAVTRWEDSFEDGPWTKAQPRRWAGPAIPAEAVYLGRHGPARRYWWGPFIFSVWSAGYIDGHVHRSKGCRCGVRALINPGDWR